MSTGDHKELPEWYLVDLHRSPPLPYANLESLAPKTLQYLGCWPSGKLAIQPRIVALAHNNRNNNNTTTSSAGGSSRGLGAAATEHL
jgi:hypothetical protein